MQVLNIAQAMPGILCLHAFDKKLSTPCQYLTRPTLERPTCCTISVGYDCILIFA